MKHEFVDALLDVAVQAARAGAKYLAAKHTAVFRDGGSLNVKEKTSALDLVTEADGEAQTAIIETIQKRFPEHQFIAEEEGADDLGAKDSPYEWIIDPLDGTTNFIHGKHNFGSIVAVQCDGELLAGAMCLPFLDQLYTGAKGQGAFINGKPVKLRETKNMLDAVLASNTIRRAQKGEDGVLRVTSPVCGSLENYGCAAQEMGEILSGWNDGAFFNGIRIWDIAAGCLMVQEAGGKYRYEWKEPGNKRGGLYVVASTAPIFEELCEFVFEKKLA